MLHSLIIFNFSHCYLFVIVLDSPQIPKNLDTAQFLHNQAAVSKRRRREIDSNDAVVPSDPNSQLPDSYIAGFFKNTELPTVFRLGNGSQHGNIVNQPLKNGKYYTTFVRAFVRPVCSSLDINVFLL